MDVKKKSLKLHKKHKGKIGTFVKTPVTNRKSLSLTYTPGVGAVSEEIHKDINAVWQYTNRGNSVGVVTDGSAVLGLGNIGPEAALPVMEGKALLMKEFAGLDAFPICLNTQDPDEIIKITKSLEPSFGAINLEDISAPRCFYIEEELKKLMHIPVFHDDQHGTAVVVLAALTNALKVVKKSLSEVKIVISGCGAAGIAIAKILLSAGAKNIVMINSKGIVDRQRQDLNEAQSKIAKVTNPENISGNLADAMAGNDVFIGVSAPGIVTPKMVYSMNKDAIVFAMANPIPEIMPDVAKKAGARIIATGRSDFDNQVNNVLAFPGIFRGALDAGAVQISEEMKVASANALANYVKKVDETHIIPDPLDKKVAKVVAQAVKKAYSSSNK